MPAGLGSAPSPRHALEEVAAAVGEPTLRVLARVVLPQFRLALCGGRPLVGLHLLGEYGLYAMLRSDTFTTAIVDEFASTFEALPANMLAGVLTLCCVDLLGAGLLTLWRPCR